MSDDIKSNPNSEEQIQEKNEASVIQGSPAAEKSEKEETPSEDEMNFFEKEMKIYRDYLGRSWEAGFKRYGFYLFHSLTSEEKVKYLDELGFQPVKADDYYNKAVIAIQSADYIKAEDFLKKALEMEPKHKNTLFNMALLLEKTDRKIQALNYWEKYLELIEDEDEIRTIAEHLEEGVE